ncbi:ABC transporter substrate-binding protein [Paenibacillus sp. WQ 127069]|uniref:ABC transporter substrate-binding protein n=1 Tax=Paenibacillus baimaensis TaxID=2982185 RepID=A0ABT2UDP3_9BACL|nr:ABC transporter substrate-binding protein [Paenibacillus sp. WQ 127069]MCU6792768.1 ABC transporter substrate-binding protein [Paenibacillus sp. WQ 127069]
MNKWTTITIATLLLAAGCSDDKEQGAAKTGLPAVAEGPSTEAGTFPLVKDKITLKVLAVKNPSVQDYSTNEFTKWYEEKTNVKIEWQFATPQDRQEKLNLVLATNDLPDMIIGFGVSPAQQMVYGQQGLFIALNNLIDKYGVETKKTLEKYPEIKQATTAPNGNIYSLSSIDRNPHTMLQQKMWIDTEWLKKLNLDMPTTTDEFEKVLKAFKEKDPNGNGKADEIPMIGGIQEKLTGLDSFLMNSFILNDLNADQLIFDDKGSIEVNFNKPGFKKGLQYLNKLYAQGLIAPESFTQNNDQMKSLVENGDARVGVISSFIPQVFSNITGKRWLDYKTVPPLKGPDGLQQTPYRYYSVNGGNLLITNASKNPEVAFRWADALYNYDISMSGNIGTEGIGWRKPTTDELGLNGKPANWVRLMAAGTLQNNNWGQTTPYHFSREMFEGLAAGPNEVPRVLYEETQKNYEPYKTKQEQSVPPVFFDDAQSSELSDLQKTIKDYVKEMTTRFIIGDASIDKEWDKYIQTLDGMNLKRYLQIYNEGYKAQYKK